MKRAAAVVIALFILLSSPALAADTAPKRKVDPGWQKKSDTIAVLITKGKFEQAIRDSESLMAELKKKGMQESYEASTTLNNLGIAYMYNKEFENAHAALVKAVAIRIKVLGKDDPETAAVWLNLADLHLAMARLYRGEYDRIDKAAKGKKGK